MIIISNFHDYYDAIQQYGRDNHIVYNRINDHQCKFSDSSIWHIPALLYNKPRLSINPKMENDCEDFSNIDRLQSFFDEKEFPFKLYEVIAVINGKAYRNHVMTKRDGAQEHVVAKNVSSEYLFNVVKENIGLSQRNKYFVKAFAKYKDYKGFLAAKKQEFSFHYGNHNISYASTEDLYKLHKEMNSPVFYIINQTALSNIPLVYMGFNQLFNGSIEAVAQEISYCLGNVIQNKNEPPIAIDDIVKLEQHGFDKKKSFRHR